MSEAVELEPCPLCASLPCDWVEDPHHNFNLAIWALAHIREITGVGVAPMLSELPDAVRAAWNRRANHGEVEPVAWPDREAVARALHARYEERARQRGQIGGDGYTVLGGARLEDCSRSLRQSFLEDADAVLSLLTKLKGEGQ